MKILVLAESLRINGTSSGIVSSTFLKSLLLGGHEVVCLYENSVSYPITWLKGATLIPVNYTPLKQTILDKIPKLRALPTYINGYSKTFANQILDWKNNIDSTLATNKFDLIICLGSGASFLPHYAMIKIQTHIPWVANFHDPYPMSVYPKPYQQQKSIILKKQERFTAQIIEKANFVSFPSVYLKEWMTSFFPAIKNKAIILPHLGCELDNLPTLKIDNTINLPNEKFNILHAGTLLGPRKVVALFNAFEKFLNKDEEHKEKAVLTILGKVAREHHKIHEIVETYSKNIRVITNRVSYKRSIELNKKADVCLIIEADADFSPFMPGKLADLIQLSKPIFALTPKKSETLRVLGETYPYQSRVNEEEQILKVLELLWSDWKQEKLKLQNANELKEYVSSKSFNKKITELCLS